VTEVDKMFEANGLALFRKISMGFKRMHWCNTIGGFINTLSE